MSSPDTDPLKITALLFRRCLKTNAGGDCECHKQLQREYFAQSFGQMRGDSKN